MAKVFGSFSRLVSLLFRKDGQDITLRPNQATTYTTARDVQLPPGDAAHVIVSADATQTLTNKTLTSPVINTPTGITKSDVGLGNVDNTSDATKNSASVSLTNKTIDADLNTITNIENADIKSSAAIARSKLASGSASHVLINNGAGGMSSEAQLAVTRGGTGVNSTATFPASGVVVTRDATETLTNKTFDSTSNALISGGNNYGDAALSIGNNNSGSLARTTLRANASSVANVWGGSAAASVGDIDFLGTSGVKLPAGTAAQRPSSPSEGHIRFNTDADEFEGYANGAWASVGGGVNELPLKNYLKTYALAAVAPGTLSTLASGTANLVSLTAFYADSTSGSAALTQSSSTALRGSTNYLSALSGADTAGGRFFQFPAFALESTDLGKPVSISFDVTGNTLDNDWDVVVARYNSSGTYQELIPVAGNASTTTATPSAKLPTGTTQFQGFFVAGSTAGDLYAVRFRRRANAVQVRLDTLYVGPQPQLSSAAVTDWQTYTPTLTGFTASSIVGRWRQVGDSMEVVVAVSGSMSVSGFMTIALPSGFTIDTTKIDSNAERQVVGNVKANDSGTAYFHGAAVYFSTTQVRFTGNNTGTWNATTPFTWAAADDITCTFRVPIANWTSNVTSAQRAVETYSADDGSSDVFGPNGALVPNVAFATGGTNRDFVFQNVRQATDLFVMEVNNQGLGWIPAFSAYPYSAGNNAGATNEYGMRGYWVSATTFRVRFGNQGTIPVLSTANNGESAWSTEFAAGTRFRVRQVQGGAAVGYPVGARNVVGDVSGTAVPAGYIGQVVEANSTTNTTSTISTNIAFSGTITVPAGVWLIVCDGAGFLNSPNTGTTTAVMNLYNNTDATEVRAQGDIGRSSNPADSADQPFFTYSLHYVISQSSSKDYFVRGRYAISSGSPTTGGIGSRSGGRIYAVRVG